MRIGAGSGDNATAGCRVGVPVRLRSIAIAPPTISAAIATEADPLDMLHPTIESGLLSRSLPCVERPGAGHGPGSTAARYSPPCRSRCSDGSFLDEAAGARAGV